jgi:exopolysaccharide biosynthesis polyprenyl glycosylphosphotransferase
MPQLNVAIQSDGLGKASRDAMSRPAPTLLESDLFRGVLMRELRRADRSNLSVALLLVELAAPIGEWAETWRPVIEALSAAKRDIDVLGWYEANKVIGVIVPMFCTSKAACVRETQERVRRELLRQHVETTDAVSIRVHVYPAPCGTQPEAFWRENRQMRYEMPKRVLDVVLSLVLLALFWPLFVAIAALVRLTSRGPVFFRQERVGHMSKPFIMLKFRTMQENADHTIHYQFVSSLIRSGGPAGGYETGLFKIANDPRVTPVGRFLRRTSLDELPQLWNVLRGDMSLVGPRPPLPYEVEQYQSWHKRRVLQAKPGLTGLWQVTGRSRTTFDEMVRLDLRYVRTSSVWTDIKILLATPRAVISGKGAC